MNERVSGSVESQYLVGAASPLGHSISSHSFFGFLGPSLLGATATRTRAKREDNQSFVPSRHLIVRHAFVGKPRASFFDGNRVVTGFLRCEARPYARFPNQGLRLDTGTIGQPQLGNARAKLGIVTEPRVRQYVAARKFVLASDEHPKLIAEFGESLINRFVSGMVVRVDAPNYNMRCEILRAISKRNRVNLSEEIIAWVARRVTQNVRELEGAVTRVTAHTRLTGRPADVILAQEALGDLDRALVAPVKPDSVLASVCSYFGLEMRELMSGRRQRTISLARSVSMFLIRKTSKLSFPEIAMKMGKRNHSTVISACRRIEKAASRNERLAWSSSVGERDEEASEMLQRLEEQSRAASL